MSFDWEWGVVSVAISILLWYTSALNWLWEKAEWFDEIIFVADVIIK